MEIVVCVLAHGEADDLDESTCYRIDAALDRLEALRRQGSSKLVLVCMAGVGKKFSEITLASRMADEARGMLGAELRKSVHILYNRYERQVWGSVREMRWAHEQVSRLYPNSRVEYVTNARHAKRVRLMSKMFGLGPCEVVVSRDRLSPLYHEVLAYLKLGAYFIGTQDWAEARRRHYSGG